MTVALMDRPGKLKLSVDQFDLLTESGALEGLERSELLDGDIYLMAPQYRRHAYVKSLINTALIDWQRAHRPDLTVLSEVSVAMPPSDEPIPDIAVTNDPMGPRGVPVDSVSLLVEIADGPADYDLGYKANLYAGHGVPEYWVADMPNRVIVRHSGPSANGYAEAKSFDTSAPMESATLEGLVLHLSGL